jgi:cysteine-rich repeat protein
MASSGTSSVDPTSGPTSGANETDPSGPTETDTEDTNPTATTTSDTDPNDTDPNDTESTDTGRAECGDGRVEGDEVCDDGVNDGGYGGCVEDCSALGPRCGDGEENGPEDCDDGDEVQGNGCNNDCVPSGLELWTYEDHVSPEDACVDLVTADAGHLYMVGRVDNLSGAEEADIFYVQRLTSGGALDWTREYAPLATPAEHDYDPFVAVDVGDGVVVSGAHRTGTTLFFTYTDVPTVKFSAVNGDVVWDRTDDFVQFAGGVVQDEDGELVIAGTTVNDFNVFLYRLSADGDLLGNTDYDDGRRARALAYDPDDTFVVGLDSQTGGNPAVLQRRNAGFGPLWEVEPDGLTNVLGVAVATDGDVFAVGGQWVGRFGQADGGDVWTLDTGDVATLGAPTAVAATLDGGAFVVGGRQASPWIARLDPDGSTRWSRTSSESGEFTAVDIDTDGAPVACGTVDGGGQGDNMFVARYTQ